ncbi:PREDICTED: mas-related G-protein coupled receptor member H-like [Calidris pugnax]|uniref:mas-related G-protein coupled receptor member H-like n=1 Tax=Calidris pugnax TaxID=198806 RepID=UPI00071CF9B0|nr:PREDICTED: mas-related G-protein coupled receptor member H-like [Calidris pugnax]
MVETNTTNLSLNHMDSGYDYTEQDLQYWCIRDNYNILIISGVFIVVCLCGLAGNMVVVWFLGFHMKKNPFTVYVLNLAIADSSLLLFILGILMLSILTIVKCYKWYEYERPRNILMLVFLYWYLVSMYLLTAMSMERCLSVLFPIWYRCHRPKHLSGIVCGVLWAVTGLFLALALISCTLFHYTKCEIVNMGLNIVNFLIFCFVPLLSNLSLFIRLRCGSQRRHPGKLYVAVLLSVMFMFIFGLPLIILILLHNLVRSLYIIYIGYLLASLNSSINPVIYFLVGSCRKRRFQSSMKAALRRVFEEKVTSEEESRAPEDTMMETTV